VGRRALGILKLEHENGLRAELTEEAGVHVFRIIVHDDLMLTPKTELFKGAVFVASEDDRLEAYAADMQSRAAMADFFLGSFLGCKLVESPLVTTERFFNEAERFINGLADAEKRARYEMALLAEMHSAHTQVNPNVFARTAFERGDHQSFRHALDTADVPWAAFTKGHDRDREQNQAHWCNPGRRRSRNVIRDRRIRWWPTTKRTPSSRWSARIAVVRRATIRTGSGGGRAQDGLGELHLCCGDCDEAEFGPTRRPDRTSPARAASSASSAIPLRVTG